MDSASKKAKPAASNEIQSVIMTASPKLTSRNGPLNALPRRFPPARLTKEALKEICGI
jgi:hypothetical protein